ncbi:class I SAM-dependent methyltransferase [Pararhodobacter sp.]|uniref:SAM-dependent methyltransferase n=1 Tax=Pararhodobacter sp. TaxID=2127056 RepID=UPI002AFEDF06|nr:class I SAM-dependent methyltransferase [Pararhodobacter sp.]
MWEDRYKSSDEYLFGQAPALFLTENPWVVMPGARALCVADGEGRNAVHLARAGMQVTAFDMAPTAVARAQELAAKHGVRIATQVSTWDAWDWRQSFDLVAAIFVQFMPPEKRVQQFRDLAQALRPGGRLLLHGYTPEQIKLGTGGPGCADNLYTEDLLRQSFPGWHIERLAAYEREVQEGRAHSGHSALIDFVARKPE